MAKRPPAQDEFVTIAKVTKPQGRRGEVAAALFTDFPERFASRRQLYALDNQNQRRLVELEEHWFHKGLVVLKFKGVDSISEAETLAGWEIQVPLQERAELEAGAVYVSDLIGCVVYDSGREVGTVQQVRFGAGEAPLLEIKGAKEHHHPNTPKPGASGAPEYLVPLAAEYIVEMSPERKRVEMKLPAGLLELDAPLTAEEKGK